MYNAGLQKEQQCRNAIFQPCNLNFKVFSIIIRNLEFLRPDKTIFNDFSSMLEPTVADTTTQ